MTHHLPFSNDYEREEAFALGVINVTSPGFPDTLRQFRIPAASSRTDSLTPLAQGSEPPSAAPAPVVRRFASLTVSLALGFGAGVAIAFAAFSLRHPSEPTRAATPTPVTQSAPKHALARAADTAPAHAADTAPARAANTAVEPMGPAKPIATPRATPASAQQVSAAAFAPRATPSANQDRRWLLDRARSEQRQYRIAAAERLYRQILVQAPLDSEALSGLGELELLRGSVELADQHFHAALDANSNYIPALIAAADIRWQSGRAEEARRQYLDIVDHYSADSYPPYVALRSTAEAPHCP